MKLARKRQIFTQRLAELVGWARRQGYEAALDEVRRGKAQAAWNAEHCRVRLARGRCELRRGAGIHQPHGKDYHRFRAIGIRTTLHGNGLAGDLLLFLHGKYLKETKDYSTLGKHWEGYSGFYDSEELTFIWGGRFQDGGHFSIAHAGRR